jgi:hypothetical protein
MTCLLLQALFAPAYGETRDGGELLQFTSEGHVLGFSPDSVYFATGAHALKADFIGGKSAVPQASAGASPDGRTQPLTTVSYRDVWDGVDAVYEKASGSILKSTYTVAAGARPDSIRLRYNKPVTIDEKGNLVVGYDTGRMTVSAPVAWQTIEGRNKPVMVAYNQCSATDVGFTLGAHDTTSAVVISGVLSWNTFLGGSVSTGPSGIAVDSSGDVYVTGYSWDTWGTPIRAKNPQGNDAFVAKLSAADGSLIWNTFLGGPQDDYGNAIALDSNGRVYVAGYSFNSWGTPVSPFPGGSYDGFVACLQTDGSLIWNTFLGGSRSTSASGIAVNSNGAVYVTGYSSATWGTPVNAFGGRSYDGWVAKLDAGGNLIWNTFLGVTGTDYIRGVALDSSGSIYVTGYSNSTWGSPVNAFGGGFNDGFIAKLDAGGNLIWNTFLGGTGTDRAYGIALDSSGGIYVTGYSDSTWGTPVSPFPGGMYNGFVVKLNQADGTLAWNTFLGGPELDYSLGIAVDKGGNLYVTGESYMTWGYPVIPLPDEGSSNPYVAKLNTADGTLLWNTFLGGDGLGEALGTDSAGNVYAAGISYGTWGTPVSPFTATGGWAAYLAKIPADYCDLRTISASVPGGNGTVSPGIQTVCAGFPASITMTPNTGYHVATFLDNGQSFTGLRNTYAISSATVDHTIVITYGIDMDTLTAVEAGTGGGALSAGGLTCSGASCTGEYAYGTSVVVTAIPSAGSAFTGWTNCDSVSGNACTVAMTANRRVIANFASDCTYSISPTTETFTSKGGSFKIGVTATGAASCVSPTVTSDAAWIGASLSSFANNKGTVVVTASQNNAGTERVGVVTIWQKTLNVAQTGVPCSLSVSPAGGTLASAGGTGSFSVNATEGCEWVMDVGQTAAAWLGASPASRSGSGSVSYEASANTTGEQREGKITVHLTGSSSQKSVFTVTEHK